MRRLVFAFVGAVTSGAYACERIVDLTPVPDGGFADTNPPAADGGIGIDIDAGASPTPDGGIDAGASPTPDGGIIDAVTSSEAGLVDDAALPDVAAATLVPATGRAAS